MFKNKKSSLSLSINAIVILILAIAMLGLALGFIRTMFGKVTTTAEEYLAAEPDPPLPTANNPITFSRDHIVTGINQKRAIKVGLYCTTAAGCPTITLATGSSCVVIAAAKPSMTASLPAITTGGATGTGAILIDPGATPGVSTCQVVVSGLHTSNRIASFIVQVS